MNTFFEGLIFGMAIATLVYLIGVAWVFEPVTRKYKARIDEQDKTILLQRLIINLNKGEN